MTKQEFIEKLQAVKEATEVKRAEDTVMDIKDVEEVKSAEGMPNSELPTQKEVEKEVEQAVDPVVPADEDGVSKNGGEQEEVTNETIAAEKKKEDNRMKDAINVTQRTYEESAEVNTELLSKLAESEETIKSLQEKIAKINEVAKQALVSQKEAEDRFLQSGGVLDKKELETLDFNEFLKVKLPKKNEEE